MSDTSRPFDQTDDEPIVAEPVSAFDHAAVDHTVTDPAFIEPQTFEEEAVPQSAAEFSSPIPATAEEDVDGAYAPPALVEPEPAPVIESDHLPTGEVPTSVLAAEPAYATSESVPESSVADTAVVAPVVPVVPVAAAEPVETGLPPVAPDNRVVYVEAAQPPRRRGNRGIGVLLAILASVVFASVYALIIFIVDSANAVPIDATLFQTSAFWVPTAFFLVGFVLLVLIVNRASWWAHVIGSLFVALFVYFGSVATLVLMNGVVAMTAADAGVFVRAVAVSPGAIAAALLARETSLWFGAAVAARGRRVKARNIESREAFDREQADEKARRDAAYAPAS